MASIELDKVGIKYPVYNSKGRSFKSSLIRSTSGGRIAVDTGTVVIEALKNISLSIHSGDRVGLIGQNGAGKSTLLRVMANIYEPTDGHISINGQVTAMFDNNLGTSLEATGWDNIETRGILAGLDKQSIEQLKSNVAEASGLGEFLDMPIRTYSTGMRTRLALCIATSSQPDILLLDEAIITGDKKFIQTAKQRIYSLMSNVSVLVLASHSEAVLRQFCDKGMVLNRGELSYFGELEDALDIYNDHLK